MSGWEEIERRVGKEREKAERKRERLERAQEIASMRLSERIDMEADEYGIPDRDDYRERRAADLEWWRQEQIESILADDF